MFLLKHFDKTDKSLKMSAPREYELHGVKIRKLPVGRYIRAMHTLEELPQILAEGILPKGTPPGQLSKMLADLNPETMSQTALRLLAVLPEQACRLLSELLDIPSKLLLDPDEGLSPAELAEILEAFWKINDMSDFFGIVRRLTGRRPADPADAGGSSSGLPSPGKSASPKGN